MILRFRLISHLLYLGVGKMVKVLDVKSGQFIREIPKLQEVHEVAVTHDGRTLITKEGAITSSA